jgi:serine/threonine protein phosphatase PrpC
VTPAESSWRIAGASVLGRDHAAAGGRCEDAWACSRWTDRDGLETLAACVCDGAGSATNGWRGARVVSRYAADWLARNATTLIADVGEPVHRVAPVLRRLLRSAARAQRASLSSFACTLAAVAITEDGPWLTVHVGDGAILARHASGWRAVSLPHKGEFVNTTFFVTDTDLVANMRIDLSSASDADSGPKAFALFSDGVEGQLVDRRTGRVAAAVESIGEWLRSFPEQEVSEAIEAQLQQTLRGTSGDDCTLVALRHVASR